MIEAGWEWKTVEAGLKAGQTLQSIADQIEPSAEPLSPKPLKKHAPPPPDMDVILPGAPPPVSPSAALRKQKQRELEDLERKIALRQLRIAEDRWGVVEAFPYKRITTSEKIVPCPHCSKEIIHTTTHIHPGRPDLRGLAQLENGALDRLRLVNKMPRNAVSIRVDNGELGKLMDLVNEAYRIAFNDGMERGLITEKDALTIWNIAKKIIDGANEMQADV